MNGLNTMKRKALFSDRSDGGCSPARLGLLAAVAVALPITLHAEAALRCSPADGLGPQAGVMRRDPSDVIEVKGLFYVWYTKGKVADGYDAGVWYATSRDGRIWTEKGEALRRGAKGCWDEQSVFTPNFLVAKGKYWLFFTAVPMPFTNLGN